MKLTVVFNKVGVFGKYKSEHLYPINGISWLSGATCNFVPSDIIKLFAAEGTDLFYTRYL